MVEDEPGPGTDAITWLGHSTVLVDVAGVRVLTDPALTPALAHLRRRHPVPTVGPVDVVAVSHLHMDHLHRPSLRRVADKATRVVVPAGAAGLVGDLGFGAVTEVRAGDVVEVGADRAGGGAGVTIEVVPAVHSSRRGPHSRRDAAAVGYVVTTPARRVYFAGDTGPFEAMADIGEVDVALLPIWGWGSSLGEHHLDPTTAAEATARLRPRHVIPIHWGTYSPVRLRRGGPAWLDSALEQFADALTERDLADRLVALRPGERAELA